MNKVFRFLVKLGLLAAVFTWWSWLWHERVLYLRSRCNFLLDTLREIHNVDGFWPRELMDRVEDLTRNGWGAPR